MNSHISPTPQKKAPDVPEATLRRLPAYYRLLRRLVEDNVLRISSGELAKLLHCTAAQIRGDFRYFGEFGQQGYGYNVPYLFKNISDILGATRSFSGVLVTESRYAKGDSALFAMSDRGILFGAVILTDYDSLTEADMAAIAAAIPTYNHGEGAVLLSPTAPEGYLQGRDVDILVLHCCDAAMLEKAETLPCRGIWNLTGRAVFRRDIPVEQVFLSDSLLRLCHEVKTVKENMSKEDRP